VVQSVCNVDVDMPNMIVSTPPPTHPPTHPPHRSLHHSPHHSPYHILHSSTPPPIPLSHSHTQAFRHVCSHRSDNLKGHIHTYFRGQLMHLFSSLASHQSAKCIPTYSSSCVCQVSHQSARCIPIYSSSCACLVSHQSARWLHQLPRCLHHPVSYNLCLSQL